MNKRGFASDNNSGIHPNILKAIEIANVGHAVGYGEDLYTEKAKQLLEMNLVLKLKFFLH